MLTSTKSTELSEKFRRSVSATILRGMAVVLIFHASSIYEPNLAQGPAGNGGQVPLTDLITNLRQEKKLVGLAAMVMVDRKVVDSAVDGERKSGSGVELEVSDRWHLGSVTKSITATMVARLVESGQMRWSDTVGECFPDASIHEDWRPVTLKQLLTHTAGAPRSFSLLVQFQHPALGPERTRARRQTVLGVIAQKPAHSPGEKFAYSNVGYTIAGAMAEHATGISWEDLVKREVFEPLELAGAGFGPPKSSSEQVEQPVGHVPVPQRPLTRWLFGSRLAMDDDVDNSPIMGPAGTIHMTLDNLCTYATEHLRGHLGEDGLLSAETYKVLHTPELNQYACGWIKKEQRADIPHAMFWHNGSNTMWYALVVFIPEKRMVIAVTSNDGDVAKAEAAAWEVVGAYVPTGVYPKKSPFSAVRWKESQPEVKLDREWFKLVSLNGLPVTEIVAFSQQTYEAKWRRRFEEDLVELLSRMGHPPQDKVKLALESLTTSEASVREDVLMTEANRQAIWAARAGTNSLSRLSPKTVLSDLLIGNRDGRMARRGKGPVRDPVSINRTDEFRKRIDEFLGLARDKAGFSGVVVVARGANLSIKVRSGFRISNPEPGIRWIRHFELPRSPNNSRLLRFFISNLKASLASTPPYTATCLSSLRNRTVRLRFITY